MESDRKIQNFWQNAHNGGLQPASAEQPCTAYFELYGTPYPPGTVPHAGHDDAISQSSSTCPGTIKDPNYFSYSPFQMDPVLKQIQVRLVQLIYRYLSTPKR